MHLHYAEEGYRYAMYEPPAYYDAWGWSDVEQQWWKHSFCVVDDFGNAVPVEPFNHYAQGYQPIWSPDMTDRYELVFPTIH